MNSIFVSKTQIARTAEVYSALAAFDSLRPVHWDGVTQPDAAALAVMLSGLRDCHEGSYAEALGMEALRDSWMYLGLYCAAVLDDKRDTDAATDVLSAYILGECANESSIALACQLDTAFRDFAFRQLHSPAATTSVNAIAHTIVLPTFEEMCARADARVLDPAEAQERI